MELFLKATAGVLLTVILVLVVGSRSKELSLLLTLAVCCMVACATGEFIRPVIDFLENLQQIGQTLYAPYVALMDSGIWEETYDYCPEAETFRYIRKSLLKGEPFPWEEDT